MSVQLANKYDATQPFHIYYDLSAINNETNGSTAPVSFQMTQTRNNPYLMSPDNYFMSVVRFNLQTPSLPVFIPQVQIGQANPNKTAYSLSLSFTYLGVEYISEQYITYVSSDSTQPTPTAPLLAQDVSTEYYYVFNLQDWCKMMNTALIASYTAVNATVVSAGGVLPSNNIPFFEWNNQAQVFQLSADNAGYNSGGTPAVPIKIFMNTGLYTLLNNFPIFKNSPTLTNGKNYQFNFYNNNGLNLYNMGAYSVIQLYQDNSTVGLFNPIQSIVFTSSLLPLVQSVVGNTKIFNFYNTPFQNNNSAPIITDFAIDFSATNQFRPNLEYTPNGEYRLIDLYGLTPLQSIEITVQWRDMFGVFHPLLLNSGCSAQLKIMFRRKDYGNVPRFA